MRCTPALTAAFLVACRPAPPVEAQGPAVGMEGEDQPAPTPTEDDSTPEQQALMHHHFKTISAMQEAVIAGMVDEVQRLAGELEATPVLVDPPEAWLPHVETVRVATREAKAASDVPAAATAVANLAAACGTCHREVGATPSLEMPPAPKQATTVEEAMAAHRWAADRMWEGLVIPSEEAWIEGTTAFVALPGCGEVPTDRPVSESGPLCQRVQKLARSGHVQEDPALWAGTYADLLTTCAACHAGETATP